MSGVICFMVVVAVMVALGLLGLVLDATVRFLAGDGEKAGRAAIQELDELRFGVYPTNTNPFVTEWRWALAEALSDISHEASVAASAIEANRPYQEMGGEMRVYRMLRTLQRVTSMTLRAIDDPAPELPDLPF